MDIRLNTTFTLFQPGRETLTPSYFLLHFVDVDQDEQRFAIVQNEGEARGPLLFRVTEMEAGNPTLGQVQLYAANWQLTVYEQTSATNQDIANAGRKVWSELIGVCEDADVPAREPYDPCIGCGEGPCDPTTVNGTESDTPRITVLQGGLEVGTLNPATGVHTVPECEECDPQLELRLNDGRVYKTLDLDCGLQEYNNVVTYPNGTEVGEWNADENRIEVPAPILCEPCPLGLVINGDPFATVADPCDDPTLSIQVRQSTGSTQVGSQQGSYWRIDDSEISINGTVVADVMAEDSLNIPVVQGGSPVGSWNGTQWVVPPCDTLCDLLGDVLPADVQDDILDCVTEATEDAIAAILCAVPADNIVEYTESGTYTKPAGLREIIVAVMGPGGGGGAGRSTSTGGTAGGGGYGGSGAFVIHRIDAALVPSSVSVTVGAGGAGGTGGVNANGGNGGDAGDSSFDTLAIAKGGGGGRGGNNPVTQGPTALGIDCTPIGGSWSRNGYAARAGIATTVSGLGGSSGTAMAPTGGNGGLRVTTATPLDGGEGGGIYEAQALVPGGAGASSAGANGSNGADDVKLDYLANFTDLIPTIGPGTAGGGGAYSSVSNGGNGGSGGKGTGGAGGGGAQASFSGGNGANGGDGFVVILERF
jgi:hypothetical protein